MQLLLTQILFVVENLLFRLREYLVGVSAVFVIYMVMMMNEHAARGLLVTTLFAADSRDFVKDKPIQLIDGQNLALLKQYGYGEFNITLGVEKDQLDK